MLLLRRCVDADAFGVLLTDLRLGDGGDAVEPRQGVGDFFGFEADRGELSGQLLVSRTRVRPPVVLVEVHEHVEHEKDYTAAPCPDVRAWMNGSAPTSTASAASGAFDALEPLPGQPGDAPGELEVEQPGRELGGTLTGAGDELVEADRVEAERVEQWIFTRRGGHLIP